MNCPHCGAKAKREETGNDGSLFVSEGFEECCETFDCDITLWRCSMYPAHIFYADDYNGNKGQDDPNSAVS